MNNMKEQDGLKYGEKAARLIIAGSKGLRIPKGFVLSYEEFDKFIEENQLSDLLSDELVNGPRIREKIQRGSVSKRLREQIQSEMKRIREETGCVSFVVRSSSNIEDGANNSMAGMLESYLKLTTIEELEEAIRKCYSAFYSDKLLNYIYENIHGVQERKMGILIQEYIEGDAFGVMFTTDPLSGQRDRIQISVFEGDSEKISQMAPVTHIYSINKLTGEIIPLSQTHIVSLSTDLGRELISLAQSCETLFGTSLDIEWTIRDGSLYLLQVRPITCLKKEALEPDWQEPDQDRHEWFRLYPEPLKPLMQDIVCSEIKEQSFAAYETLFRTDTNGECIILQGYAYVRSIPIEGEGEKRKAYLDNLKKLTEQGSCIYHDVHLPKLQEYVDRLNQFMNRKLTLQDTAQFLILSKEYHDYCARYHWNMVQANEFLYRFEREFLDSNPNMALSDFYELVSGFTLQTRDRELLFQMADAVNKKVILKEMFAACSYDGLLYRRLLPLKEARELFELIRIYLEEFGTCDSVESWELLPILQERPDYILGYVRRVLDLDSSEFYCNVRSAEEKSTKLLLKISNPLDEKGQEEFIQKVQLAQKAFLSNDNHNYYVERMFRGFLRAAVSKAEELLLEQAMIEKKGDLQYFYYDEVQAILQGKEVDELLLKERKAQFEKQRKLEAPELFICNTGDEERALAAESYVQKFKKNRVFVNQEEPPFLLKGVSGLKKSVIGRIYMGIPNIPQEAILVMPHCHYGDIMPVISKVKGLIFLWGSPYDHPAIIARELGIPAMYYVAGAMDLLKTGDEVELDGYNGLIRILSRADRVPSGIKQ